MKKILKKIILPLAFLVVACDMDSDLENPNEVSLSAADVNLVINAVQLDFADFYNAANGVVNGLVRHTAMTGGFRYQTAYQPQNQDDVWNRAYRDVLINAKTAEKLAVEKGYTSHVAIAKILSAYTYITLVDLFGDVPQSEALLAEESVFNPAADGGSSVYAYAITLLTEARTELAKPAATAGVGLRDIYYGGSRAKWAALANTLELKCWVNISTTASRKGEADGRIATLLGEDLIDTADEDFTYKYSATTVPNSRHPQYNQFYGPNAGQAGGYLGTSFLFELYRGKPDPTDPTNDAKFTQDPRWRYYVARQAGSISQIMTIDPKAIGCTQGADPAHYRAGDYPFCVFDPGFYGRDHGDASGTPPDAPVITAAGVYPAGGRVDNTDPGNANFKSQTQRGQGANGAGILPIFMHAYLGYYQAEILARDGDGGAKAQLGTAIAESINSVRAFATSKAQSVTIGDWATAPAFTAFTNTYIDAVGIQYDAEPDALKAIGRETWIATWGNGVEAYNSYRRTGGPTIMQPTIQTGAGPWMRSVIYSANYVNLNDKAVQKNSDQVTKVFWDGNPGELN